MFTLFWLIQHQMKHISCQINGTNLTFVLFNKIRKSILLGVYINIYIIIYMSIKIIVYKIDLFWVLIFLTNKKWLKWTTFLNLSKLQKVQIKMTWTNFRFVWKICMFPFKMEINYSTLHRYSSISIPHRYSSNY